MSYYKVSDGMSVLVGKTFTSVTRCEIMGNDGIMFETANGENFALFHEQDCCEDVYIEDICGDLTDLEGTLVVQAEEVDGESPGFPEGSDEPEYYTWTFFKFATNKGSVTIRFFGSSNGCYSETAELYRISSV